MKKILLPLLFSSTLLLTGCETLDLSFKGDSIVNQQGKSIEVTEESYTKDRKNKAVILFDANWGRQWGCATNDHARLFRFAFDRLPLKSQPNDAPSDITISNTNTVFVDKQFLSYAMLVEPGEYALTLYTMKVVKNKSSGSNFWGMYRNDFKKIKEGHGGTFTAKAGETVYIGNFFVDCYKEPMIWRYYTEEKNLKSHLGEYKDKYPFLDVSNVTYRLFDTKIFGRKQQ